MNSENNRLTYEAVDNMLLPELKETVKNLGIKGTSRLHKQELKDTIKKYISENNFGDNKRESTSNSVVENNAPRSDYETRKNNSYQSQGDRRNNYSHDRGGYQKNYYSQNRQYNNRRYDNSQDGDDKRQSTYTSYTDKRQDTRPYNGDRQDTRSYHNDRQQDSRSYYRDTRQSYNDEKDTHSSYSDRRNDQNASYGRGQDNRLNSSERRTDNHTYNTQNNVRSGYEYHNNDRQYSENSSVQNAPINFASGILDIMDDGYGFLRSNNYQAGPNDVYVPQVQIRRFKLKSGDYIEGNSKMQHEGSPCEALIYINSINGDTPSEALKRQRFEDLTPIYPCERLKLETCRTDYSMRIIDLIAPVGKGQRGIIVAPPKAGKTTLLKTLANSIKKNNPDVKLIVLLIDERPEEVTDMQRSIDGDVVYSTFDEEPQNHVKVAEIVLNRAKRLVEHKNDVVILLDSITRLARANNLITAPTGRTLSGGLDPGALYTPKRFFGAARNIEEGGSLTILSTALIETGSRMDDMIYEEFKGTGNMEVHLDRKLQEKRIFPAIDIAKSGTRKEELLLTKREKDAVWNIRRAMSGQTNAEVTESILRYIIGSQNNEEFISVIEKVIK